MTENTILKVENVSKSFGDLQIYSDTSIDITEGGVYGILGPNGSGKTTLINMITGQLGPDSGVIEISGINPTTNPLEVRSQLGVLPEKQSPYSNFTPREYFHFIREIRGLSESEVERQIEHFSDKLQYQDKLDTYNTNLSRGQQQKVMFTQAFLHQPNIVVIDEPVANLDPEIQEIVLKLLEDYANQGNTIFLATHNLEFASRICSEALFISPDSESIERKQITDYSVDDLRDLFK